MNLNNDWQMDQPKGVFGTKGYVNDYKVIKKVGPNGKEIQEVVYDGPLYEYRKKDEVIKRYRLIFSVLTVILTVCWGMSLAINNVESHVVYIMLPLVCVAIPLYYLIISLWRFVFNKAPLTREQHDKISKRPETALKFMVLLYVIAVGSIAIFYIMQLSEIMEIADFKFAGLVVIQAAAAIFMYLKVGVMKTKVIRNI